MPRPSALLSLLALALAGPLAAPLAAQPPTAPPPRPLSDSVPRELVQALLPNSDGLRVGEPAGDLPRELLPTNGLVLGSVEYGGSSLTLVVLMQPEHDAIAAFVERATAVGWTQPPNPSPSIYEEQHTRGFVSAGSGISTSMMVGPMGVGGTRVTSTSPLCKGDAMVTANSTPWSGGRTLLRVQAARAVEHSPCRRDAEPNVVQLMRTVTVYDSIVPALQPPPGAHVRWRGGGGDGTGEWSTNAAIETTLPANELLAHYAREMRREGWEPVDDGAATPTVALQTWRKADAKGVRWYATTTFQARPDRGYHASLRLERSGAR